jgi:hypothetical protein
LVFVLNVDATAGEAIMAQHRFTDYKPSKERFQEEIMGF